MNCGLRSKTRLNVLEDDKPGLTTLLVNDHKRVENLGSGITYLFLKGPSIRFMRI
jgi:hypothetical protein